VYSDTKNHFPQIDKTATLSVGLEANESNLIKSQYPRYRHLQFLETDIESNLDENIHGISAYRKKKKQHT